MKEFLNFFGRQYSAVSTNDNSENGAIKKNKHKSLQSKPTITRGLTILDSFFHKREVGKRARWPKCKNF
jgi:hypothetical protein